MNLGSTVMSLQLILITRLRPVVVALIDHKIVSMWFPVLINRLRIIPFDLGSIVANFQLISISNKIAPNGSGINRSRYGIRVVPCFFLNRLRIVPFNLGLIVMEL